MFRKHSLGLILLGTILSSPAFGQKTPRINIDGLSWMAGCWEVNDRETNRLVSEQWMKPAGKSMLGMARTVKNGITSGYEFIRIVQDDKGVFYVAKPSQNTAETPFKLVTLRKHNVVFENPEHDFPQRISYRRDGDKLHAAIAGLSNGKNLVIDYPMTRARCD